MLTVQGMDMRRCQGLLARGSLCQQRGGASLTYKLRLTTAL